ncbi:MAG: hypothetical protein JNL49_11290 [Bacteroidia bacterium]|nr:hypothetical protein [Bacteroidia bacterium]
MTNQNENSKTGGVTHNAANNQNPKTGNQKDAPVTTDNDEDVDNVETTESENTRTGTGRNQTEAGRRDDTQNDPTRIRPGVNEPGKTDPTGSPKQDNRK